MVWRRSVLLVCGVVLLNVIDDGEAAAGDLYNDPALDGRCLPKHGCHIKMWEAPDPNQYCVKKENPDGNPKIECMDNSVKTGKDELEEIQKKFITKPYPPFGDDKMEEERVYYQDSDKNKKIKVIQPNLLLEELNHYLYKGKEDFKSGFRVLSAGGGTGDNVLFLAEQLNHTNAQIVYIDFSKASMEIAQERAKIRHLSNIIWINDFIENIPNLNLGKFDFIDCSGVLHHLKDSLAGLKILKDSLTEKGGMNILVYGTIGRTGVYQMQELMRKVNKKDKDMETKIENTKKILVSLPSTNWFKKAEYLFFDYLRNGDEGLYNLFLHELDVSFTIRELYDWIWHAGLQFVDHDQFMRRIKLSPDTYIKNEKLMNKIFKRTKIIQQAIGELMTGDILVHSVYVSNVKDSEASLEDLDNVLYIHGDPKGLENLLEKTKETEKFLEGKIESLVLEKKPGYVTVPFKWPIRRNVRLMIELLFKNGRTKTIQEMFQILRNQQNDNMSDQELLFEIEEWYQAAKKSGQVLLKSKNVEDYPKSKNLELFKFTPK